MSTFPKSSPSESSDLDLVLIDRNNLYRDAVEHQIKLASTCLALSARDDDRRFQKIRRREETRRTGLDRLSYADGVRFVQQHSDDGRRIYDHQPGSPCSS